MIGRLIGRLIDKPCAVGDSAPHIRWAARCKRAAAALGKILALANVSFACFQLPKHKLEIEGGRRH